MNILISGASGLIGTALYRRFTERGDKVSALVRRAAHVGELRWDPYQPLDGSAIAGFDAIVHLSGKNIAGRWTAKFKEELRRSRIESTRTLATAAAESFRRRGAPRVFVSASAIGFYGNRGDEELTETSPPGTGFLPDVCLEWERSAQPARDAGLRVVHIRIGVVLARGGGALPPLLLPFKLGLGGRTGSGRQFWSWISLDDVVGAFIFALDNPAVTGPVNAVSPNPARNVEFVQALARELHRPAVFPLPAFPVRAMLGEMGQALLLDSARVKPAKLEAAGYRFIHPDLPDAIHAAVVIPRV